MGYNLADKPQEDKATWLQAGLASFRYWRAEWSV